MKIELIQIKPMGLSHEPEFHITIEYSYRSTCLLPLRFNGYIFLEGFRLAFLTEFEFNRGRSDNLVSTNAARNAEKRDQRVFVAPLSRLALNKLEDKRLTDAKDDLKFDLYINFVFIESLFNAVRPPNENVPLVSLTDNSLMRIVNYDLKHEVSISSSEWLHDFAKVFGFGKYQILEIPIPEISPNQTELGKRVNSAIHSLTGMEKAKMAGDWETVLKESRPVWELIRNRDDIASLLKDDDFNGDTVKAFNTAIDSLFNFSSKFIHRESLTKELMTVNKARKEDAELIYAIAVSIINLLAKKINRYR